MKESRTVNSIKNSSSSVLTYIVLTITSFVSQTFFIKILGNEYLGLNGLFSNILSMLSLFELGIGSAIIYNLYKPIINNDIEEIKSLMSFYKKAYNIITLIILILGLSITPFINLIVKSEITNINFKLVYILMLTSTVSSYILTYKRSILYAHQKEFIINIIHIIYLIILNLSQILILIYTKNYYLYLSMKILFQLVENIVISFVCDKKYPYIKEKGKKLNKNIENKIITKVKAMLFHKIGGILVFSTDNLIINKFIGLVTVGLYSNYNLIINAINNLVCKFIEALIPSVGNLLAQNDSSKIFNIFKNTRFINFCVSCISSTCLLLLLNPFIKIWLGEEYLLNEFVVIILIISYYQKSERYSYSTFKTAAGIWEKDKMIPIGEAMVNLIASIILAKCIGLPGVFIGTILSSLVLWLYGYPKYIYIHLFKRKYKYYFIESIKQLFTFFIILLTSYGISKMISTSNNIFLLVVNLLIGLIVPNVVIIVLYYRTDEYTFVKNILINFKNKIIRKNRSIS